MFRKQFVALFILCVLVGLMGAASAGVPKNVILFIGDGMGPGQVKAARCYMGSPLSFESFPYQTTVSTNNHSGGVTDSAAAATAMATGVKVNNGVISLAIPGDGHELFTLLEDLRDRGKSTGLVTTTYIAHATPAGFGAHEPSRGNLLQIATDYLTQTRPQVLFGGGANGISVSAATAAGYTVVTNYAEMQALDTETAGRVSGQFGSAYLPYEYDVRDQERPTLPHLSEMTQTALDILDNDPDGMFLMVEGGLIDPACHSNDLVRAIYDTIEFNNAVQKGIDWAAGRTDTLILVTADHETGGLTVTQDNGPGNLPGVTWSTGGHTQTPVPLYGMGVNAERVPAATDDTHINEIVSPAEADAGADRYVYESVAAQSHVVHLDGSASRKASAHSWEQVGGIAVALAGAGTTTPEFVAPQKADGQELTRSEALLRFRLTINSGAFSQKSDEVEVYIRVPGDANGDDAVNAFDLALLRQLDPAADFNDDSGVNAFDLAVLRQNSGRRRTVD